jgi:hypothetical protein
MPGTSERQPPRRAAGILFRVRFAFAPNTGEPAAGDAFQSLDAELVTRCSADARGSDVRAEKRRDIRETSKLSP